MKWLIAIFLLLFGTLSYAAPYCDVGEMRGWPTYGDMILGNDYNVQMPSGDWLYLGAALDQPIEQPTEQTCVDASLLGTFWSDSTGITTILTPVPLEGHLITCESPLVVTQTKYVQMQEPFIECPTPPIDPPTESSELSKICSFILGSFIAMAFVLAVSQMSPTR